MKITLSTYEFLKKFPDEKSARTYVEQRRWKNGVICPCCGSIERIQTRKVEGYFRCLSCTSDFTVRTGTIFERSHVALDKWLYTMYLMAISRKGISSLQLSKEIGVTQKTKSINRLFVNNNPDLREPCDLIDKDFKMP